MPFLENLSTELQGLSSVQVLDSAIAQNRLSHAVLLSGPRLDLLEELAQAMAQAYLGSDLSQHPDLFLLRPANKMRQISADAMRGLIKDLNKTAHQSGKKVAIIYEADRMNLPAANAFLKTLEEPAEDTTLFLLSTRPYDLLDTIHSRCFHFKISVSQDLVSDANWRDWLGRYKQWVEEAINYQPNKKKSAELILKVYGLTASFEGILAHLSKEYWAKEKEGLDSSKLDSESLLAMEAGASKILREILFTEITMATRDMALLNISKSADSILCMDQWTQSMDELARSRLLLEVNCKEPLVLETFLLASLKTWTQRG